MTHAARTRNLSATASLLRSANGLLDFLSKIEKAKAKAVYPIYDGNAAIALAVLAQATPDVPHLKDVKPY